MKPDEVCKWIFRLVIACALGAILAGLVIVGVERWDPILPRTAIYFTLMATLWLAWLLVVRWANRQMVTSKESEHA